MVRWFQVVDASAQNPRQSGGLAGVLELRMHAAFTLVEMLVAMAITLVMMAAVVTLFANVSNGVRKSRATMEMSGQIRQVRNVLQQDLQGATCPGQTWQRPESNHGYIEIIEGPYREGYASNLIDGIDKPTTPNFFNPEIDHTTSILPASNLPFTTVSGQENWVTDGGGLGDYDDILMLTVRNEQKPFVGRAPNNVRPDAKTASKFNVDDSKPAWGADSVESTLAEVVWFAVENPESASNANNFYGEPGMRTIYRRALLIAPWLNPYRYTDPKTGAITDTFTFDGGSFKAEPGLLRILLAKNTLEQSIASLIAFQDRYDISARLEWDVSLSRWKIVANTLGDLTKRENRFCHFGYLPGSGSTPAARIFPFPLESTGFKYTGSTTNVAFEIDPEAGGNNGGRATANIFNGTGPTATTVVSYSIDAPNNYTDKSRFYSVRPFAFIPKAPGGAPVAPATTQAMLNDDGAVVRVQFGLQPLWGTRRGQDVMLSDVLAFDLRVYDPGAPIFATRKVPGDATSDLDVVLTPSDPGWRGQPPNGAGGAYFHTDNMGSATGIGTQVATYPFVGQGAYVDLGYGYDGRFTTPAFPKPIYASSFGTPIDPWFFTPRGLMDPSRNLLAPGFAVYDTWSFHYENDGLDEDHDGVIDQGTNGLDDFGNYWDIDPVTKNEVFKHERRLGPDDVGERETTPPYDKPLRGLQVLVRAYERDSRAIRQTRVTQHFLPE